MNKIEDPSVLTAGIGYLNWNTKMDTIDEKGKQGIQDSEGPLSNADLKRKDPRGPKRPQ